MSSGRLWQGIRVPTACRVEDDSHRTGGVEDGGGAAVAVLQRKERVKEKGAMPVKRKPMALPGLCLGPLSASRRLPGWCYFSWRLLACYPASACLGATAGQRACEGGALVHSERASHRKIKNAHFR